MIQTDVQNPAETSPAVTSEPAKAAPEKPVLGKLSEAEYKHWRKTGDLPQPKKAEAAPATKKPEGDTQDASADQPESGTGNQPKPKLSAEERIKQLAREKRQLAQELERLKAVKPEAKADVKAVEPQDAEPTEPNIKDFDDWDSYQKAMGKYTRELARYEAKQQIKTERENQFKAEAEAEQERLAKAIEDSWNDQLDAAEEAMPDIRDRMRSDDLAITRPMALWMKQSDVGAKVLAYLIEHPQKAAEMAKLEGRALLRAMVKLEDKFEAPEAAEQPQEEPKPKVGTPVKATKAAPPAKELATNGAAPMDELQQAIANKDFARYRELMNRRERNK